MDAKPIEKSSLFSLRLLKYNWHLILVFYFAFTLLVFTGGYFLVNAKQFSRPIPFYVFMIAVNLLIILCAGFVLEMKEASYSINLKMRLEKIFTPWINLKKYEHVDDLRYWIIVFAYCYAYAVSNLLVFLFSYVFGSIVSFSFYLFAFAVVFPNAIFQMFFIAIPFTTVLAPTEKSQYLNMLSPSGVAKYTMNLVKPLRWKIFLFFLLTPWINIFIASFFFGETYGRFNTLCILAVFTLIPSLLLVLYFFFMASWVIHRMTIDSDEKKKISEKTFTEGS